MTNQTPRAFQVRAKTQNVVEHHYDETRPGKPLFLVIPGGIVALICLVLEYYIAFRAFWDESLAPGLGVTLMVVLLPFFIGSVFVFSYGYEEYDMRKALRLTAIIVIISLAAVVIVAVLFVLAGGPGKSSSSSSSSKSSGSKGGGSLTGSIGSLVGGSSSSSSRSGDGPIFVNLGGPILSNTVTREIVHDTPKPIAKPQPFACQNCGRPYMPNETQYACPNCGAPTPKGLFACLNCGTQYIPSSNNFKCPTCLTPTPSDATDE